MALSCLSVIGNNQTIPNDKPKTTISNKFLYYNFEQYPAVDQYGTYSGTGSSTSITATRAKYGTQSVESDGIASSTKYIYTNSNTINIGTTAISFSMWFYITAKITTGDCKIFESGGNDRHFIRIPRNTQTFFFCDRGSAVTFNLNTWNHVVCTIDSSGNGQVYLNNVLSSTFTDAGKWSATLGRVYVGRSTLGGHNSILGSIDDFRIYSKVLTSAEVTAIYTNDDI